MVLFLMFIQLIGKIPMQDKRYKTNSIEDYLCNRMFKVNIKRLLNKPDELYTIAKYHFTFGTDILYIVCNERTKIYSVRGTRNFSLHFISANADGYIFFQSPNLDAAKNYYMDLLKEYIEFHHVMY